jgi:hypothetical protein
MSPPHPYWEIDLTPDSTDVFSTNPRGMRVDGSWGFYDVRETSSSLLSGAVADGTATNLTVDNGLDFSAGHTIRVDSEQMYVRRVNNDILQVERGVNGTSPATHADDSAVQVYTYPVIAQACLLQASRIFARKNSPYGALGVAGSEPGAIVRITATLDPDVRMLLENFRLPVTA